MALDTLFLCFCEDHNMNYEADAHNFAAPPSLLSFMMEASKRHGHGRQGASPIPRKSEPEDEATANGEELMPMKTKSYEVDA